MLSLAGRAVLPALPALSTPTWPRGEGLPDN